jgi:hypothetical protein
MPSNANVRATIQLYTVPSLKKSHSRRGSAASTLSFFKLDSLTKKRPSVMDLFNKKTATVPDVTETTMVNHEYDTDRKLFIPPTNGQLIGETVAYFDKNMRLKTETLAMTLNGSKTNIKMIVQADVYHPMKNPAVAKVILMILMVTDVPKISF